MIHHAHAHYSTERVRVTWRPVGGETYRRDQVSLWHGRSHGRSDDETIRRVLGIFYGIDPEVVLVIDVETVEVAS